MVLKDIICNSLSVADKFDKLKQLGAKVISTRLGNIVRYGDEAVEYDTISDVWTFSDGEVYLENL